MLVAQLSDFHITVPGALYQGVIPTNDMARAAVAHLNALDPQPEIVLFTGDLVECGTSDAYAEALKVLRDIKAPVLVQPGNHDNRENFRAALREYQYLPKTGPLHYCIDDHDVRFVGLDSTITGKHHGATDEGSLAWLGDTLREDRDKPTIVFTHHHPMRSGIPYLDAYDNRDGPALAEVLKEQGNIVRLVFGHVHRFMAADFGGTIAISCPSTASQIALRLAPDARPASFMEPPGLLLHDVQADRPTITHLIPIGSFGAPMDFF